MRRIEEENKVKKSKVDSFLNSIMDSFLDEEQQQQGCSETESLNNELEPNLEED
jgi:hypothetical protein